MIFKINFQINIFFSKNTPFSNLRNVYMENEGRELEKEGEEHRLNIIIASLIV